MSKRVWKSGPPPHVGWWNASNCRDVDAWRWWDGEGWSFVAYPHATAKVAADAGCIPAGTKDIKWTNYYPANARVPRIDPGKAAQ